MNHTLSQTAVKIIPLGAGSEVGRSCVLCKFRGVNILFDCGVHPAYMGVSSLPFFDLIDPSEVDAILITHFHLDHAGALPYFTERTEFKGKVYMTHPTRAIFRWLLNDYVRVSNVSSENDLFTEKELSECYDKIIPIDYGQEIKIKNMTLIAYNAGHVLGAAMFLVRNEDLSLLYTGDYSREEDRHLKAATVPKYPIDILISESTYGVQCHQSKEERELRFTSGVSEIVKRGGKCLLPVFALGRAQELLLILDEFWGQRKDLQDIPIYYASALAKRCMAVYQTYLNMMNDRIQEIAEISNPFHFKYVQSIKNIEAYEDRGPCVVMASPGMLQNGLSRELFELWCEDRKNGCIIPGYCVDGTLAKELLCDPDEITSLRGNKLQVKSSVDYISFSAHVDFIQNAEFIEECKVSEIVLVHGEATEMSRLKSALIHRSEMRNEETTIHTPRNGEWIEVKSTSELNAHYLSSTIPEKPIDGFIHISEDGKVSVVERTNLKALEVTETKIIERAKIPGVSFSFLLTQIQTLFNIQPTITTHNNIRSITIEGVNISEAFGSSICIEWESTLLTDIMANCIIKSIEDRFTSKPYIHSLAQHTTHSCSHPKPPAEEESKPDKPTKSTKKPSKQTQKKKGSIGVPPEAPISSAIDKPEPYSATTLKTIALVLSNYFDVTVINNTLQIEDGLRKVILTGTAFQGDISLAKTVQEVFDSTAWIMNTFHKE
ncbi:cleavage and polyadenylation specificity factor subunit 3 [Nematocida sp. AWRm80]|nr:cleavage and polyadenylation specificity factor subunit 3 [Nematocida sp. AWRm80]